MSEGKQETRHELRVWDSIHCKHCGLLIGYWPSNPICPRQANQPQGKAQPESGEMGQHDSYEKDLPMMASRLAHTLGKQFTTITPIPYSEIEKLILGNLKGAYIFGRSNPVSAEENHREVVEAFQRGQQAMGQLNSFLVFLEECFAGRIEPTSPAMQMIEDDRERVRQAMAEKAAQVLEAEFGAALDDIDRRTNLAERTLKQHGRLRLDSIKEELRSLASAAPPQGEAEKEGRT